VPDVRYCRRKTRLICCCAHLQCIRYSLVMLKCQDFILLICQTEYGCFAQQSPQLIHGSCRRLFAC